MSKNRQEILESMLKLADYYWYNSEDDSISNKKIDIERFDPVIDHIFKSNSYEIERLYQEIDKSNDRIVEKLVNVLIPDKNKLPKPAFTVASVNTKYNRIPIKQDDIFKINGVDDYGNNLEFYFTSMFDIEYPKTKLKYLITDSQLIDYSEEAPKEISDVLEADKLKKTKSLWIGLDFFDEVQPSDRISFYIGNTNLKSFDYDTNIFKNAKWYLNGNLENELDIFTGLGNFQDRRRSLFKNKSSQFTGLADYPYEGEILDVFRNSFATIQNPQFDIDELKQKLPPIQRQILDKEFFEKGSPLVWIKLEFITPISNDFFLKNRLYENAVLNFLPVVILKKICTMRRTT